MAQYDIYKIEERLQEYDENLSIRWNDRKKQHEVLHKNLATGHEYVVMAVPVGKLDARVYNRITQIDHRKGYNPFDEIQTWMHKKERDEERKLSDMAYGMADVLYKPLVQDAFY